MEPKQEHAFKRPRAIPPRQHIAHQSRGDADTEATTVPQHASSILAPEKWVRVICGRPVVVIIVPECAT
eukprot:12487507-Prorocentrum_lima.AAC.1